jgi:putative drug exporter of the RND superfamily
MTVRPRASHETQPPADARYLQLAPRSGRDEHKPGGTDYNIFLMTRVHEEAGRYGTRRGALVGLAATGGVITSAGVVLAGTFAALGTLPLVFVTEIGFAVAFGVLLDTFVVRSVLVTALNLDVGRWIWWPSSLHRKHDVDLDQLEAETAEISR